MKKNTISYVDKVELVSLKERLNDLNYFVVTIPGKKICTFRQYLNFMGKKFKMPDYAGFAAYSDWMTDLSWIPNQKIAVIINEYGRFMNKKPKLKSLIMDSFEDGILPFWEKDVVQFMVGGKPRIFEVYIVK
ncbi:hypothetical protein ACA598_10535 [Lactiplantibacillus pentosus]|uniref:barstar family protein n=1 Tax=Lactiplantibacillus pentosus TaxID=1589 RepID=UPI003C1D2483